MRDDIMPEALTDTPRILNSLVEPFVGSVSGDGSEATIVTAGTGWDVIDMNGSSAKMFRWRGYIDLGGLEREALTFFLQSAQVTESDTISSLGITVQVTDVISKVPISDDDLNTTMVTGIYAPGYLHSNQDMEQVLWARSRATYHDSGWTSDPLQQHYWNQIWGEGISTSASRLHLTRYVVANDTAYLRIPGACFQVVGTALQEPDLNYIMRLRRDYELAS